MIYGPNTEAVQSVIDRISTLTKDEYKQLGAAWNAAYDTAWEAGYDAAWEAVHDAAREADCYAAWEAVYGAANVAARDAVLATVTYDLATINGPYTIAQRDLLLAPWVSVCGMPEGLIARAALDGEG